MTMHITELAPGDRVRLVSFGKTTLGYRRRLLALGITKGVEMVVIRFAPLGCPIQMEVRGTAITLRREEAKDLCWEPL